MSKILTRDDFLSERRFKRELVEVPELDGSVYLRELSTRQLLEYNERIDILKAANPELSAETSIEMMCLLISMSACDEEGKTLFTEEDVVKLSENKIAMITRLSTKVLEISGIGEKAKEVAANLKNALEISSVTG